MSHIEIGYFEEKVGDHFNYWRNSTDYYWNVHAEIEPMKPLIHDRYTRNLAGITPGDALGGLTTRFDAAGWASHSVLVNCIDIMFAVPIFYSLIILLNAMTVTNPWSQ